MIKKILTTFFVLFISAFHLNGQRLSESAYIGILTCGSGNELYSTFGHTAIHICDTSKNINVVFNYGTFNFDVPYFYLKFSQGRLLYMLSVSSYNEFLESYKQEGRWIIEQKLNLTWEEKEKMTDLLMTNYMPANRYYAYDFFMDNCATRVRDIIKSSLEDRSVFNEHFSKENKTFRELIYPYMNSMLWWRLGIDLALGMRCDKPASEFQYMFLPNELMYQLDTINFNNKPLVETKTIVSKENRIPLSKSMSPTIVSAILCIIVMLFTFWENKKKIYFKWLDIILFTSISILSLLIAYLWFCSNHYSTKFNFNLLWANPLFIYALIRLRKTNKYILYTLLVCLLLPLLLFWLLPQTFNTATFPLMFLFALRIGNLIKQKRKLV